MTTKDPSHPDESSVDELLAEALAAGRRELKSHPSPDELLAFERRILGAGDQDRIEEHLAVCPTCTQAVLDLAAFPDLDETAEAPVLPRAVERTLAADWRRMKRRLEGERSGRRWRTDVWLASSRLAWGMAGLFFLVSVSLAAILLLERPKPRVDIAFATLSPEGNSAERGEPELVPLAPWADGLYLLLSLGDLQEFPAYRLSLLDAGSRPRWTTREVHRSQDGTFRVEIPRSYLEDGGYLLELFGTDSRGDTPLATYRFEVQLVETR